MGHRRRATARGSSSPRVLGLRDQAGQPVGALADVVAHRPRHLLVAAGRDQRLDDEVAGGRRGGARSHRPMVQQQVRDRPVGVARRTGRPAAAARAPAARPRAARPSTRSSAYSAPLLTPAAAAMSATRVPSYPRSAKTSAAARSSRSRVSAAVTPAMRPMNELKDRSFDSSSTNPTKSPFVASALADVSTAIKKCQSIWQRDIGTVSRRVFGGRLGSGDGDGQAAASSWAVAADFARQAARSSWIWSELDLQPVEGVRAQVQVCGQLVLTGDFVDQCGALDGVAELGVVGGAGPVEGDVGGGAVVGGDAVRAAVDRELASRKSVRQTPGSTTISGCRTAPVPSRVPR